MKWLFVFIIGTTILVGCKGGSSSSTSFNSIINSRSTSNPVAAPPATVETQKLVSAIQTSPAYKIDSSELSLLKSEGVITDQDMDQMQAIQ
jgi:hypothetical protein